MLRHSRHRRRPDVRKPLGSSGDDDNAENALLEFGREVEETERLGYIRCKVLSFLAMLHPNILQDFQICCSRHAVDVQRQWRSTATSRAHGRKTEWLELQDEDVSKLQASRVV